MAQAASDAIVNEQEKRLEDEMAQLLIDIRRIGPTHAPGKPRVLFGELFDDDDVQQYYEALVGTLKSAKKRGLIRFKGQMLLRGVHDKVTISIVGEDDDYKEEEDKGPSSTRSLPSSGYVPVWKRRSTPSSAPKPNSFTFSPLRKTPTGSNAKAKPTKPPTSTKSLRRTKSAIVQRKKSDICGTCSDSEAFDDDDDDDEPVAPRIPPSPAAVNNQTKNSSNNMTTDNSNSGTAVDNNENENTLNVVHPQPFPLAISPVDLGVASDSESSSSVRKSPRRVNQLKKVFQGSSFSTERRDGRPPTWRKRKTKSVSALPPRRPLAVAPWKEQKAKFDQEKKEAAAKAERVKEAEETATKSRITIGAPKLTVKTNTGSTFGSATPTFRSTTPMGPSSTTTSSKPLSSSNASTRPKPAFHRAISAPIQTSKDLSSEVSGRVEDEVQQLIQDIRRVGTNPGEPSVTFGELFDDDIVQNTYEALVGTLRSAKRQGYITFRGQMLLKGMHDKVVISVSEK